MQTTNRSQRYKIFKHFTRRTIQLQIVRFRLCKNGILVGGGESVVLVAAEPLQSKAIDDGIPWLHRSPILANRNRLKEERHLQFRRRSVRANHRKRGILFGKGSDFNFNYTADGAPRWRNYTVGSGGASGSAASGGFRWGRSGSLALNCDGLHIAAAGAQADDRWGAANDEGADREDERRHVAINYWEMSGGKKCKYVNGLRVFFLEWNICLFEQFIQLYNYNIFKIHMFMVIFISLCHTNFLACTIKQ